MSVYLKVVLEYFLYATVHFISYFCYFIIKKYYDQNIKAPNSYCFRISFDSAEECSEWWRHITSSEAHQTKSEDLFAFKYFQLMKANPPFSSFSVDSGRLFLTIL